MVLCVLGGELALFGEELGVVARELLERDEEVAEDDLEGLNVGGVDKKALDEVGDLSAATVLAMNQFEEPFY